MGIVDEFQKLEQLRLSGTLSNEEFAKAKALLLGNSQGPGNIEVSSVLVDQLAELQHQNELAGIDREWEIERQQFLIVSRYGRAFIPTIGIGIATVVVGGGFGALWTVIAYSILSASSHMNFDNGPSSNVTSIFPVVGILFTVGAVIRGIICCVKAQRYNEAYEKYRARRLKETAGNISTNLH